MRNSTLEYSQVYEWSMHTSVSTCVDRKRKGACNISQQVLSFSKNLLWLWLLWFSSKSHRATLRLKGWTRSWHSCVMDISRALLTHHVGGSVKKTRGVLPWPLVGLCVCTWLFFSLEWLGDGICKTWNDKNCMASCTYFVTVCGPSFIRYLCV